MYMLAKSESVLSSSSATVAPETVTFWTLPVLMYISPPLSIIAPLTKDLSVVPLTMMEPPEWTIAPETLPELISSDPPEASSTSWTMPPKT